MHAVTAFAGLAAGADRGGVAGAVQVQATRVNQLVGMPQFAAEADGKGLAAVAVAGRATLDLAGQPEIAAAVGHARNLGQHAAGLVEGFVDDP